MFGIEIFVINFWIYFYIFYEEFNFLDELNYYIFMS